MLPNYYTTFPGKNQEIREETFRIWEKRLYNSGFSGILNGYAREHGPVAQLGERSVRIREVEGSSPFRSTRWTLHEHLLLFQRRLCRAGVAVMAVRKIEDFGACLQILDFSIPGCGMQVVLSGTGITVVPK